MLVVVRDDDAAGGERLLGLGPAQLGDGERGRDGHDARGDEGGTVDAKSDVGHEHGAGDCGEARAHDLVQLGDGEVRDKGLDQHGALALADKGRRGGDDGLSARDAHRPEDLGRRMMGSAPLGSGLSKKGCGSGIQKVANLPMNHCRMRQW